MNPFNPGDKVRCTQTKQTHHANWSYLVVGDVYTVNVAYAYSRIIRLKEIDAVIPQGLHFHTGDFELYSTLMAAHGNSSIDHDRAYDRAMKGVC